MKFAYEILARAKQEVEDHEAVVAMDLEDTLVRLRKVLSDPGVRGEIGNRGFAYCKPHYHVFIDVPNHLLRISFPEHDPEAQERIMSTFPYAKGEQGWSGELVPGEEVLQACEDNLPYCDDEFKSWFYEEMEK